MSVSVWDATLRLVQAGNYAQAAENLERAHRRCMARGDLSLAQLVMIMRRLCLVCLECYQASYYHHQSLLAMTEHLEDLQDELLIVMDLMRRIDTGRQPVSGSARVTSAAHADDAQRGLWQRLQAALGRAETVANPTRFAFGAVEGNPAILGPVEGPPPAVNLKDWPIHVPKVNAPASSAAPEAPAPTDSPALRPTPKASPAPGVSENEKTPTAPSVTASPAPETVSPVRAVPDVAVTCLGIFRVYLRDQLVDEWPSRKGKAIFKYLIANRQRPISKEVLMDMLWPDAPPEAARNNLNVAIYGLRQVLRQTDAEASHVLFQDDCYLINPDLKIWVDIEEFDEHIAAARRLEANDLVADAIHAYHLAEELYQGDFMEDERYEDWPTLRRQQVRDTYLNIMERVCNHYFEQGAYATCLMLYRKMLAVEICRESTHRRIMECYAQQGQRYLAIRQYQTCVDMLSSELEVAPSAETTALYERILAGNMERAGVVE